MNEFIEELSNLMEKHNVVIGFDLDWDTHGFYSEHIYFQSKDRIVKFPYCYEINHKEVEEQLS